MNANWYETQLDFKMVKWLRIIEAVEELLLSAQHHLDQHGSRDRTVCLAVGIDGYHSFLHTLLEGRMGVDRGRVGGMVT